MKKYKVLLCYERPYFDSKIKYENYDTIEECSKAVREFILDNDVMSSEWLGGKLYENGKLVGMIAYNGKYFPREVN